jgi:Lrp/AsnC family transcriptional regulator for asnA, asnC and gidA
MAQKVELDGKDVKILNILIINARARLKDIAKECGISSVSALNRIKRLKKLKIITGSTLFPNLSELGLPFVTTIGVTMDGNKKDEVIKVISEQTNLVEPSASIGKYDLCALVFAENISELNKTAQLVKRNFGAREVALNIWSGPIHMMFENIDLRPMEEKTRGQA